MNPLPLFTEDSREEWTDEARTIDQMASNVLRPIFEYANSNGYSIRDVQYIVEMAAMDLALSVLMDKTPIDPRRGNL